MIQMTCEFLWFSDGKLQTAILCRKRLKMRRETPLRQPLRRINDGNNTYDRLNYIVANHMCYCISWEC
ncbi:hypothetical protein JCM15764A_36830 [Geotalea toluenoxydans]